jgi:2-polyprenyl-6-hydroxyphenyl methylase/3-demethylubiquinone-9 3-methyltransferase
VGASSGVGGKPLRALRAHLPRFAGEEKAARTKRMNSPHAHGASVDPEEVERFARIAEEWWDPKGPLGALHRFNPARLGFIRREAVARFGRDNTARAPFEGLRLLDVGCGGGLLCEPMSRLGFSVTGIDAAQRNIEVAAAHAQVHGLAIDYRCVSAEELLAEGGPGFDLVLNMEVVEHVADPGGFLRSTADLVAPGGMMIVATLNRTLRALALGKIAAEYVLGWAPRGAHDWSKFLKPEEIRDHLGGEPVTVEGPFGMVYNPLAGGWAEGDDCAINYLMTVKRPG